METITVLSPHRDDAAFSLGLTLSLWSAASLPWRVLNFFTESDYAPHSPTQTIAEISAVRQEEDQRALRSIHDGVPVISLGLLDAPLRLKIPLSEITWQESVQKVSQEELDGLSEHVQRYCTDSLTVVPLGLGNHVDHLAVQKAALTSLSPQNLAFYEDLPYATWTSTADLQTRVEWIEGITRVPLRPFVMQADHAVAQKRRIASFYRSQITAEEADAIARHAETHGNGERLWLPAENERWKITALATELRQKATPGLPRQPRA